MALAWPFRTRSVGRDRNTDIERVERLSKAIADIRDSIAAELKGLEARYEATAANAAFLDQAIENGDASRSENAAVDEMVDTMRRYHLRTSALTRQLAILDGMLQTAGDLADSDQDRASV